MAAEPLAAALAAHRVAVARFQAQVRALPSAAWNQRATAEAWTPAQITEHVTLVYMTLSAELAGRQGFALILPRWARVVLRMTLLPTIFRSGRLPTHSRAPREIRPQATSDDPETALTRLHERSEAFLTTMSAAPRSLRHPYFGALSAARTVSFCTIHLHDHQAQLPQLPTT